jgi:hypothetical protein
MKVPLTPSFSQPFCFHRHCDVRYPACRKAQDGSTTLRRPRFPSEKRAASSPKKKRHQAAPNRYYAGWAWRYSNIACCKVDISTGIKENDEHILPHLPKNITSGRVQRARQPCAIRRKPYRAPHKFLIVSNIGAAMVSSNASPADTLRHSAEPCCVQRLHGNGSPIRLPLR